MIKKFSKINYGSYQNFVWDTSLPEFKKLNIFYGRNYAGKTTLSRILRSFEVKESHPDYPNITFEIELDNSTLNQTNIKDENKDLRIRVYNKDFIRDNLSFLINDSAKKADIKAFSSIVVGKSNKENQAKIEYLKQKLGNKRDDEQNIQAGGLYGELESLENERERIKEQLKEKDQTKKIREKASEIKNEPLYANAKYESPKLKNDIESIKDTFQNYIISKENQQELIAVINDNVKQDINFNLNFNIQYFVEFKEKCKKIIETKIRQMVEVSNEIRKWLEEGLKIHNHSLKEQECKFCQNTITQKRIQYLLDNMKDDDKENLEKNLTKCVNEIENDFKKQTDNITNQIKSLELIGFYAEFHTEIDNFKKQLDDKVRSYNDELKKIKLALQNKLTNIYNDAILTDNLKDYSQEIAQILQSIKNLCDRNNQKTKTLDDEKKKARDTLRLNEVAEFIKNSDYFKIQNEITTLNTKLNKIINEIDLRENIINDTEKEIENLENSLSDEKAGADKANEYLKKIFGHNQLEFKSIADKKGKFEIHRAGKQAKNLSEGECSLLAFCYFVAKLQDKDTKDKKPIIWIDDPISSLDNNHIFFIFSLIDSEIAKSKNYTQLFISTHNLEFLKYLKRLLKEKEQNKLQFFHIENIDKNSQIKQLPKYLSKYTTEFNYLFEQIYNFQNIESEQDEDKATMLTYNFGNNLRKFLEIYLFFKYPCIEENSSDTNKMEKFFKDDSPALVASLINRYQNEYSHLKDMIEKGMNPIDIAESKKIAEFVIQTIKTKDKEQFDALLESIGKCGDISNDD